MIRAAKRKFASEMASLDHNIHLSSLIEKIITDLFFKLLKEVKTQADVYLQF